MHDTDKPSDGGWTSKHSSAVFLFSLVIIGLLCLLLGIAITSESPADRVASNLLLQVGAVGITGALAALFLSFRDVREQLIAILSNLWIDARLTRTLSQKHRMKLAKSLALSDLAEDQIAVDETLYRHLHSVTTQCLGAPIIRNYNETITRVPHKDDASIVDKEDVVSFTLDCAHFHQGRGKLPYKFCFTFGNPWGWTEEEAMANLSFSAAFGSDTVTKEQLQILPDKIGTHSIFKSILERELAIDQSMVIRYSIGFQQPVTERGEIIIVRYPCRGFNVSFRYLDGYDYDYAWFAQWTNPQEDLPRIDQVQPMRDGIVVTTNDWLLPGEGVSLDWSEPWKPSEQSRTGPTTPSTPTN